MFEKCESKTEVKGGMKKVYFPSQIKNLKYNWDKSLLQMENSSSY